MKIETFDRRGFLSGIAAGAVAATAAQPVQAAEEKRKKALIAITLDLEMARNFPNWEDTEWDYTKGNLNEPAKRYATQAGKIVRGYAGRIHYFAVGQVFEQRDVSWLADLARDGHPIGNHTYDHIYVRAKTLEELQFRYQRAPWLVEGKSVPQVILDNLRMTKRGIEKRLGVSQNGFRTPGGFADGLDERPDLQKLLADQGFTWISSKYPAHAMDPPNTKPTPQALERIVLAQAVAQPYPYPNGLIEVPMSPISDINAFRGGRWRLDWFLEAIKLALDYVIERGWVFDFLAHPSCLYITDPEFKAIRLICEMVAGNSDRAELATLDRLAERGTERLRRK